MGTRDQHPQQKCCWITYTNSNTHDIIRQGLDRSPLYTGVIGGVGPRYCPSIEDKVTRFSDRNQHQIFIEPEGLDTQELYPNGISTSLPFDIQFQLVRSIRGFEKAHITRPGYAIEYDYFNPQDLRYSLETKSIAGLFFAGQINGTTGYEEAAAQGLLAGVNAALEVQGKDPWCPGVSGDPPQSHRHVVCGLRGLCDHGPARYSDQPAWKREATASPQPVGHRRDHNVFPPRREKRPGKLEGLRLPFGMAQRSQRV
jgi:hypothetical protein